MFLLLDTPNLDSDRALAEHITFVHQHKEHPDLSFEPLSKDFIRAYIAQARQVRACGEGNRRGRELGDSLLILVVDWIG